MCYMLCPSHSSSFYHTNNIGWGYRSLSSSLCSFLHSRHLVPLRPKYSPQHPILRHPQPMFQVSHPYKTKGKITVMYFLIFKFLDSDLEDKRFCTEWKQAFPDFNLPLISSWIKFWFVKVVPKYCIWTLPPFQRNYYYSLYCDFDVTS